MAERINTGEMSITDRSTENESIEDNDPGALPQEGAEPDHPGFPLFVKYLPLGTSAVDLERMFGGCSTFRSVFILRSGSGRKHERGLVIFDGESERLKAWDALQESCLGPEQHRQMMLWPASPAKLAFLNPRLVPWEMPARTTRQENWTEKFFTAVGPNRRDKFVPGCVALLPPWDVQKPEHYIDPRLEHGAFNHPVILLRRVGSSLYNIVICSSTCFPEGSDRPAEQHRYVQFEHFPHEPYATVPHKPIMDGETLKLRYGKRFPCRTFAGTTVYTISILALARFWNQTLQSRIVDNLDVLLERIKSVEDYYETGDARNHPSWRGGKVPLTNVLFPKPHATRGQKSSTGEISASAKSLDEGTI